MECPNHIIQKLILAHETLFNNLKTVPPDVIKALLGGCILINWNSPIFVVLSFVAPLKAVRIVGHFLRKARMRIKINIIMPKQGL